MNLNITSTWEHSHIQPHHGHSHLLVTITAEGEATASQPYLDIRVPRGVRIRYIGDLPHDGMRNTIGVDLPEIAAGESVQLLFAVKTRHIDAEELVPEIHLHWRDIEADRLIDIDQPGTALPIRDKESPSSDPAIAEIVANTKSEHSSKETNRMRTRRHRHEDDTRHGECSRRTHRSGGHRFGEHARGAWREDGEERSPRSHMMRAMMRMQKQMRRRANLAAAMNREEVVTERTIHEVTRTTRPIRTKRRRHHRGEGRDHGHQMGRSAARIWHRDSRDS